MGRSTITRLLGGAWLIVAALPAFAVDPVLHSDELSVEPPSATVSLPDGERDYSTITIEAREIKDLGSMPAAPEVPDDLWQRIRSGFSIPDLHSPLVVQREAWYSQRPDQVRIIIDRSRRYLFHIVETLERRGMPTELALLPMLESAYNPMAYSRAHASGLWQFIPSTGRNYNLGQNWWYDARRDTLASTSAALDYLQSLRDLFGDWHLALAAYNMGENGVQRAIDKNRAQGRTADYQSLAMPKETRRYVPSLQALKNIVANPAAFGVELDPVLNAPYFVTVTLTHDIDLRLAAVLAEMPVDELLALNPGHNRPVVATAVSPQLVLPTDRAEVFIHNLEGHDQPLSSWQTYTFKAGDKLDKLAADHGLSVGQLKAINGLGPKGAAVAGQQLLLPQKGSADAVAALPLVASPARTASYIVKRGDTWAGIAKAFGVKVDDLKRWNGGAQLAVGESLVVDLTPKRVVRKPATRSKAGRPTASSGSARPAAPTQASRPSPAS